MSITPNMSRNVQGDTPRFTCSAMGGSGNMFSWTRLYDNTIVGNTSDLTVNVNGATDGGQYRCEVSNLAGNDSDNTTVIGEWYICMYMYVLCCSHCPYVHLQSVRSLTLLPYL